MLNSRHIANHGYVEISEVGLSNNTALICTTDLPARGGHSGGDWISPHGVAVDQVPSDLVPGLVRSQGPMKVQLMRLSATEHPQQGMYHCEIRDYLNKLHILYVGLYITGEGKYTSVTISKQVFERSSLFQVYFSFSMRMYLS